MFPRDVMELIACTTWHADPVHSGHFIKHSHHGNGPHAIWLLQVRDLALAPVTTTINTGDRAAFTANFTSWATGMYAYKFAADGITYGSCVYIGAITASGLVTITTVYPSGSTGSKQAKVKIYTADSACTDTELMLATASAVQIRSAALTASVSTANIGASMDYKLELTNWAASTKYRFTLDIGDGKPTACAEIATATSGAGALTPATKIGSATYTTLGPRTAIIRIFNATDSTCTFPWSTQTVEVPVSMRTPWRVCMSVYQQDYIASMMHAQYTRS